MKDAFNKLVILAKHKDILENKIFRKVKEVTIKVAKANAQRYGGCHYIPRDGDFGRWHVDEYGMVTVSFAEEDNYGDCVVFSGEFLFDESKLNAYIDESKQMMLEREKIEKEKSRLNDLEELERIKARLQSYKF